MERKLRHQLGDFFVGIVQISEDPRPSGADLHTGGFQACIHPVIAEVTFLGNRHEGVNIPRIVRAGSETILTTDAPVLVDDHDSVFLLPGGLDRTVDDTGRAVTLVTERREKVARDVGVLSLFDHLHPGTKHP